MNGYATRLVNEPEKRLITPTQYHIDTGFFVPGEIDTICNYCSQFMLRDGELFNGHDYEERKARLHFIEQPDSQNRWIYDKINTLVGFYNDTIFGFDLIGYKYMQYAEYDVGGHQKFHADIRYGFDGQYIFEHMRKLSLIVMLSDSSEYEGGDLSLEVSGPGRGIPIRLEKGQVLMFPSFIPHQVNPVTSGLRKTLVTWILGPKFR